MATGLEKFLLEFVFDIRDVQFNHEGRYYLKVIVRNSFVEVKKERQDLYSKIRVQKGGESYYEFSNTVSTDIMEQVKPNKNYKFQDHKFTFYFPKGFCKNDQAHDVHLVVEAHQLEAFSTLRDEGRKVGEATFAIYPRTNAPKVKENAALGENLYKTGDKLTLLRTSSTNNLIMHCGRLSYVARFRKIHSLPKFDLETSPIPSPTPREELDTTGSPVLPESPQVIPPPTQSLPWQFHIATRALESPLPRGNLNEKSAESLQIPPPGKEQIHIFLHSAKNLPTLSNGLLPTPFGSLNTKSNEDENIKAPSTTHSSQITTHQAIWEEPLVVEIHSNVVQSESVVLKICDATTKDILVRYALPVSYLQPFHHYHLELVQAVKESPESVRVFASILRTTSYLPEDQSLQNFIALEVILRGVKQPLLNPFDGILAVGRMVSNYSLYKQEKWSTATTASLPSNFSVATVSFPDPQISSFSVPGERSAGHPQITLPGKPSVQPIWNHSFIFTSERDKANLFTPGAALVLEFYQTSTLKNAVTWKLQNPIGFSIVLLDNNVYKSLSSAKGRFGVRFENVPIQESILKTVVNQTPTIGLIVRLIQSQQPEALSEFKNMDFLPELDFHRHAMESSYDVSSNVQTHSNVTPRNFEMFLESVSPSPALQTDPRNEIPAYPMLQRKLKKSIFPIKEGELPPHEAMESVLPEYQYIFTDPNNRQPPPAQLIGDPPNGLSSDLGPQSVHLLDYQMRELEKYRAAVHKMGQDILTLRQQIRELEAQNSGLRRDLSNYNDSTKMLMDSQDLDGLTKAELAARYVALKRKLASQTSELKTYRERTQKLQNDMIKKNDQEKQLNQMSHAHKSQNELVQKLQDKANKVRKLEDVIKKQEKVIEKYERMPIKGTGGNDALSHENLRLREEIAELRYSQSNKSLPVDDSEKLELYEKLEKAEGRIISLEKQMTENARKWGRERSDMLVRMQELDHGFRGSPAGYSYPKLEPVKQYHEPRRYSKPPPKATYASSYY